jgi:hypothetical protein
MADSSQVDAALVTKLMNDAPLTVLVPDGIFFDVARQGATKFVIVSQLAHEDNYALAGETAFERFEYLVKAVELGTSGANVSAAAARIHALLQNGSLAPTGYTLMRMQREGGRIRYTEVDDASDARWQHRGGRYEIVVSPET